MRYTLHKNAMSLSYDDQYSIVDRSQEKPVVRSYGCMLTFDDYQFDQPNTQNVQIRTPAQQVAIQKDGQTYKLTDYIESFLRLHIGEFGVDWEVRPKMNFMELSIFFRRKKDALVVIKKINEILLGMKTVK